MGGGTGQDPGLRGCHEGALGWDSFGGMEGAWRREAAANGGQNVVFCGGLADMRVL